MLETKGNAVHSARQSLIHFFLMAVLLVWPLILIYKDGIFASFPILVGCYGAAFSLTSIEDWCLHVLPTLLPVLGLIVITLVILKEQL